MTLLLQLELVLTVGKVELVRGSSSDIRFSVRRLLELVMLLF